MSGPWARVAKHQEDTRSHAIEKKQLKKEHLSGKLDTRACTHAMGIRPKKLLTLTGYSDLPDG